MIATFKDRVFPRPEWDKVWANKDHRVISFKETGESRCSCLEIPRLRRSLLRPSCKARRRGRSRSSSMWMSSGKGPIWRLYSQNTSGSSRPRWTTRKPKDSLITRSNTCLHRHFSISLLAAETQSRKALTPQVSTGIVGISKWDNRTRLAYKTFHRPRPRCLARMLGLLKSII